MPFKVYYLDDEPMLCENFADTVASPEVVVETFQDARAFLERCAAAKPDLALLDYRLPDTTGDEVAAQMDPTIPKVLITGDIEVKTKFSFAAILQKPTAPEEFLSLIAKFQKSAA